MIYTRLCFGDSNDNCFLMLIDTGLPITWIPTIDCYSNLSDPDDVSN